MNLVDFLKMLPIDYLVEIYFYWDEECDRIKKNDDKYIGFDEEVSMSGLVEDLLRTDFFGYGSYWHDTDVMNKKYGGRFTAIIVNHEKKQVELNYISYSND